MCTRQKAGHFRDILISQSLNIVLKKLNLTQQQELSSCWDGRPCQSKVGRKVEGCCAPFRGGWVPI